MSARSIAAVVALSLVVTCSAARAASTPPGVNLRWDNCYSDGGAINKTFACDTNSGSETLVMSFVLDGPMADVSGQEIRVLIVSSSPTLPSWWSMRNAGTCRFNSLALSLSLPPGSLNCEAWGGPDVAGIGAYNIGFSGPNTVYMLAAVAVPPNELGALAAGQEYFIANITINHAKTVGAGACLGCDVPVCIVLDQLVIDTPVAANNRRLVGGANGPGSEFAHWQGGQETNVAVGCSVASGCFYQFTCVPATATGTRGSTWGAVKALYR